MKTRYRLIPQLLSARAGRVLGCLPILAFAACSSTAPSADGGDTQPPDTSTACEAARRALLHNAPPPVKLLNAAATMSGKLGKKTATGDPDATTPQVAPRPVAP